MYSCNKRFMDDVIHAFAVIKQCINFRIFYLRLPILCNMQTSL